MRFRRQKDYGDQTTQIFTMLARDSARVVLDTRRRLIVFSDREKRLLMPERESRGCEILNSVLSGNAYEYEKDLAEALDISPQELSMFSSETSPRKLPRNIAIALLALSADVPSLSDIDHILMELCHPGLFSSTYDRAENRRNALIRIFFRYAAKHPEIAGRERLILLNTLMSKYATRMGLRQKTALITETFDVLDALPEELCEDCDRELPSIGAGTFRPRRLKYRQRFMEKKGITKVQDAIRLLARLSATSEPTVRSFFSRESHTSKCSRDNIIFLALALECDLEEANAMLVEANHALLYPNEASGDVEYAQKLLQVNNN